MKSLLIKTGILYCAALLAATITMGTIAIIEDFIEEHKEPEKEKEE